MEKFWIFICLVHSILFSFLVLLSLSCYTHSIFSCIFHKLADKSAICISATAFFIKIPSSFLPFLHIWGLRYPSLYYFTVNFTKPLATNPWFLATWCLCSFHDLTSVHVLPHLCSFNILVNHIIKLEHYIIISSNWPFIYNVINIYASKDKI